MHIIYIILVWTLIRPPVTLDKPGSRNCNYVNSSCFLACWLGFLATGSTELSAVVEVIIFLFHSPPPLPLLTVEGCVREGRCMLARRWVYPHAAAGLPESAGTDVPVVVVSLRSD